ncbi:MAG: aminotransferase class I/II-fold pyridoxal phosphate-dependent enzyme, partial [Microcystaceae cyanobacterium]
VQSQAQIPILETLQALVNQPDTAFYAPGHKRGQGISQPLADLLGKSVFRADLPELPELDNLFAPEGVIEKAQSLAAEAFGSEKTWFLVNGSTCGVMAAILATCGPGDKIILPRNIHQSAIAGLILSGAIPIFINPEYNSEIDLAYSITPEALEITFKQHPDAKAVMIVYPTYHGVCGDIEAIVKVTHRYNIPLLVDEAHGAHFTFHPALPPSALSAGADLSVQSIHKVLGAMTQASMLHLQGKRIDFQRISNALQLLQSTSPNYLLLASLDAARQQMALQGNQLLSKTLQLAEVARSQISQVSDLSVLELEKPTPSFTRLDSTRLTVNVSQLGLSGFEADEILHEQLGVTAELPMLHHLTFIITIGNTTSDIDKLVQAFMTLASQTTRRRKISPIWEFKIQNSEFRILTSPRDAFFAPTETLALALTVGCLSAELVCPYPPGIPVLMPGEVITSPVLDYLQQVLALGARITGCSDSTLKTLKVIRA